jgi:peptidoglycan/LPS O-acetylase OafA/YrhL
VSWTDRTPLGKALASSRLPALDGLRMVAVLMVVVNHAGWLGVPADLGVNVFFVLSGFLITWLLIKEREQTGTISLRSFYLRRAFRLLPAYYAYLAIAYLLYFSRHGGRTDFVLPSLLYYANYFNALHGHPATPISHTWSLAIEEQFYVLWPITFGWLARSGRRLAIRFLVVAIVAVVAWRSFLYLRIGVSPAYVYNAFDTRFDNLAVGCLAALLTQNERVLQGAQRWARHWSLPLVTCALLYVSRHFGPGRYHYSVGFTVEAALIAVAMIQIMQLAATSAWKWLDHPAARFVGTISYPMYLYHGFATTAAMKVAGGRPGMMPLVAVVCAIPLGALSYYIVEKPFLRLRARLTRRGPEPAPEGPPATLSGQPF